MNQAFHNVIGWSLPIALEKLEAVFICHFREKLLVWAIQNLLQSISRKILQFPHYSMHTFLRKNPGIQRFHEKNLYHKGCTTK